MDSQNLTTPQRRTGYPSFLGCASTDVRDGVRRAGIYAIINQANGKMYVGSSKRLSARWSGHKTKLRQNSHHSSHLQRAWNKGDQTRFQFVILCFCASSELITKEQYYMNTLRPAYNLMKKAGARPIAPGRKGGWRHSEETKLKMRGPRSSISGKNNPMFGVSMAGALNPMWGKKKPETSEFNRRTKKGKTLEEMHGDRADAIRESRTNRGEANGRFGKGRAVLQLNMDGSVIAEFSNVSRAGVAMGKNPVGIYQCLAGIRNIKTALGYKWKYKDEA